MTSELTRPTHGIPLTTEKRTEGWRVEIFKQYMCVLNNMCIKFKRRQLWDINNCQILGYNNRQMCIKFKRRQLWVIKIWRSI